MFELSGVNYEEVLEQGDSILVRVIASSSYRGFGLSRLYCIYKKRKDLPFKIQADLTTRRSELLDYAKDHVENDPRANEVANFVFCDGNCKMKIFSKSEKFFAFSSEYEFLSIINRLDNV